MKYKIIFGIAIPIFLIILIAVLASSNNGFSAKSSYVTQLNLGDVYSEGKVKNLVEVGKIEIKNDYFLPKRYSLPLMQACLFDKEGVKQPTEAGSVEYNEGDYNYNSYESISYKDSRNERSVEIGTNTNKTVKIFIRPSYMYYSEKAKLLEEYSAYDEIILVPLTNSRSYYNCYNIQTNVVGGEVHISFNLK